MAILINIISIILVITIIAAIIYTIPYLRKIKQKNTIEKKSSGTFYEKYNSLNKRNPEEKDLTELDKIAKDLFKERDNMEYKKSYIELAKDYKTSGETTKSEFCEKMSKIMYSEESPKTEEIIEAMDMFEKVMDENK
jgi:hypothetical protein